MTVVENHVIKAAENLRRQKEFFIHLLLSAPFPSLNCLLRSHLFIFLALFSEGITSGLLKEADGNVVHLFLVEHGESVGLLRALG